MTYEIYRYIFLGGAILAGIMLAVSVIVFFVLNIPTVIGDLSGANARRAIENIRNQNESTGDKAFHTGRFNRERGKLTDKMSLSGRVIQNPSNSLNGAIGTEKLSTKSLDPEAPVKETTVLSEELAVGNETTVLSEELAVENETTVLSEELAVGNETTVLSEELAVGNETTVLSEELMFGNETTVLSEELMVGNETTVLAGTTLTTPILSGEFVVEYEITYIHTDEVIA